MEGTQSIDRVLGAVTAYERGGRFVSVGGLSRERFNGEACYRVEGRGSVEIYLGDGGAEVLHIQEHNDGTWTLWYRPADKNFQTYVSRLEALGEWR